MDRGLTRHRVVRFIPAIAWMAAIFAMSSRSELPHTPGVSIQFMAIAGHFIAYGLLAIFVVRALQFEIRNSLNRAMIAFLFTLVYGMSDEFHQSFVPGRDASVGDLVVDGVGALVALAMFYFVSRWLAERIRT